MNMKKITIAMMMFAMMLVLAACGGSNDQKTEDDNTSDADYMEIKHELDDKPVKVKKNPEKVVVFDFGILDTLDELDVKVAGVPKKNIPSYLDKYEGDDYTNIGGLKEPDLETIHSMKPDVIFISGRQSDMYEELSDIAPTVYVGLDTTNYMESFKANMDLVAEMFDKKDEMAKELEDIDQRIEAIQEKAEASDDKALIVLGNQGKVSAYGQGSRFGLIHDVFKFKAADEKIESSTHGQDISFEYILETNPDVLFVIDRDAAIGGDASAKDAIENSLVEKTNAYKNDAIYYLDPNYWYLSGGGLLSIKEMVSEIEKAL